MNMLQNDHHPGPRCSCAECLRKYPDIQPPSNSLCWQLRDWFSGADPDSIGTQLAVMAAERLQRDQLVYDDLTRTISSQLDTIERLVARVTEWDPMMPVEASLFDELRAAPASLDVHFESLERNIAILERAGAFSHATEQQEAIAALTAQPPTAAPDIAAIRAVIAEMIAVAADGDRDADWTADNCAQIDKWQVRLADAIASQGEREGP